MALATSMGERGCCEEGRICLMITSTRVTFASTDMVSPFCFTTRILRLRVTQKWWTKHASVHVKAIFKNKMWTNLAQKWHLSSPWTLKFWKTSLHRSKVWNRIIFMKNTWKKISLVTYRLLKYPFLPFQNMQHLCCKLPCLPHPVPTKSAACAVKRTASFDKRKTRKY